MKELLEKLRAGVRNDGYDFLIDDANDIMKMAADVIEKMREGTDSIKAANDELGRVLTGNRV